MYYPDSFISSVLSSVLTDADDDEPRVYRNTIVGTIFESVTEGADYPGNWSDDAIVGWFANNSRQVRQTDRAGSVTDLQFNFDQALPEQVIVLVDVRFDGEASSVLQFTGSAERNCQIVVTPSDISLEMTAEKRFLSSKGGGAITIGKMPYHFSQREWHQLTIEICNKEMLVYTDAGYILHSETNFIGYEKNGINLMSNSRNGRFDNLRIFAARPNRDWVRHKTTLRLLK